MLQTNVVAKPAQRYLRLYWVITGLVVAVWVGQLLIGRAPAPKEVPYSELLGALHAGRVTEASIEGDRIVAVLAPATGAGAPAAGAPAPPTGPVAPARPESIAAERLPGIDETAFVDELRVRGVKFSGHSVATSWWQQILVGWLLPFGLMAVVYVFVMRRMRKASGPLSFGKSKAKIFDKSEVSPVTFDDVAGVDEAEAELVEVVDFLKQPDKYHAVGARIPKGVLLVGPPGTGKTLLARAVAGEAGVAFFHMSGSDFIEMFVGVGASRMRDLFEQAKTRAPCIVFIDEIDAIGRSRGGLGAMAMHDEREQTLGQLLAEMDGFEPGTGVVIMAATNRPEVLDPALVRAGRFDRQVLVDRPDLQGRLAILRVHVRKVHLGETVELETIARRTPGMVGADIANVVNEAALAAARHGATEVETRDFEEAVDRIQLGLKKTGRLMSPEEKRRVAHHEAGHALVARTLPHADPVHRVTIIPRSIGALGATLQLPTEDRYLLTRDELRDRLCVMMAGRAAEEAVFGDSSTGAQNDLERATETARQMVTRFGMSERLGAVTYGRPLGARFLEGPLGLGDERNYSEASAQSIDGEVRDIVGAEYRRALGIVSDRREALEKLAARLLAVETIDRAELEALVPAPHGGAPAAPAADD